MSDLRKQVKQVRRDFDSSELNERNVPKNPFELFQNCLQIALDKELKDANAFTLSTAINNEPDSRIVLLRDVDEEGLTFYTNYSSKKAKDMENNPSVSVNFFWAQLDKQIRIKGTVKKLDSKTSDEYFSSRPRNSQLGAWASNQSDELESREALEKNLKVLEEKFEKLDNIPRPDFWGGYLIIPNEFEFWQGRPSRLHDRLVYEKTNGDWVIKRLYP